MSITSFPFLISRVLGGRLLASKPLSSRDPPPFLFFFVLFFSLLRYGSLSSIGDTPTRRYSSSTPSSTPLFSDPPAIPFRDAAHIAAPFLLNGLSRKKKKKKLGLPPEDSLKLSTVRTNTAFKELPLPARSSHGRRGCELAGTYDYDIGRYLNIA